MGARSNSPKGANSRVTPFATLALNLRVGGGKIRAPMAVLQTALLSA